MLAALCLQEDYCVEAGKLYFLLGILLPKKEENRDWIENHNNGASVPADKKANCSVMYISDN